MRCHLTYLLLFLVTIGACDKFSLDVIAQEPADSSIVIHKSIDYSILFQSDSLNAKGLAGFLDSFPDIEFADSLLQRTTSNFRVFIGNPEMDEAAKALAEIDGTGYVVRCEANTMVVAGTNETWTAMALYDLEEYLFENELAIKDSVLTIPDSLSIVKDYSDPQLLSRLIQKGYDFLLSSEYVLACPGIGDCMIGQGATGDNAYFYVINKNAADNRSIIARFDIGSKAWRGQSAFFNAGHSNDMTYNQDKNLIIVAHGKTQGQLLTLVRASDLTVISDVTINVGAGSISYNGQRKQYALSQGGTTLHITDDSFHVIHSYTRKQIQGYTVQGMGSDDCFIYFPMSGGSKNIIEVYDWEGNYLTTMDLPIPMESESLFYTAGEYYVSFNRFGSELYRIIPVLNYKYER